jgi:adenylate kinase
MNIVFLGAPGTGKGTIAAMLAMKKNFNHIAPGNLFREEVKKETELGKKVKALIDSGTLVPDEITNRLIKKYIKVNNIFDGFPRTIVQAEALDTFVDLDLVVLFDMTEDQIVTRLSGRRTCPQCQSIYHIKNIPPKKEGMCDACGTTLMKREDDNSDVVRNRFNVFHKQTAPLINLYRKRGLLKKIDGSGTVETVYNSVKALVK